MNHDAGIFRWLRFFRVVPLGFLMAALHTASGDPLDNWTTYTFPNVPLTFCSPFRTNGIPIMWKVVFHHGTFVVAGTGPCYQDTPTIILRSADNGSNWVLSPNEGWNGFYGMTVTPDAIVAVGFWGEIAASSGGDFFYSYYHLPGNNGISPNLNAVTYGAGRFVAVGEDFSSGASVRGVTASSTDGFNWTAPVLRTGPSDGYVTVAFGRDMFWAASPSRLYRSTSGTGFGSSVSGDGERIICFGNDRFVRVANSLYVNTNGIAWVTTPWPTANPFNTIAFGAGMFLATSGHDVASSVDGFNWIVRTNVLPRGVRDLAFGNGIFMAVGNTCSFNECAGEPTYFVSQPIAALGSTASSGSLWVHGVKNRDYEIMATNMVIVPSSNWPVLNRITLTNSPQWWTDPNPPTNGQRFYRSRLAP